MANGEQQTLSHEYAVAAVADFFARENLPATLAQIAERLGSPKVQAHADLGPLLSYRGQLGTVWVSPRRNVVYYNGKALPRAGQDVNAPQGFEIARAFAERHVEDFAGRNFITEPSAGSADLVKVRWVERPVSGRESAIYPNWVEVAVAVPSGQVTRFSASDLRLSRAAPPVITEPEARTRIKRQFGSASIEEIELMQLPKQGIQSGVTAWTALVMTLSPEGPTTVRVTINADTGETLPD